MQFELTAQGYLILDAAVVAQHFTTGTVIVLHREGELLVMPVHDRTAGGLLLKQRNARGDRSVLVTEFVGDHPGGLLVGHWDAEGRALHIALGGRQVGRHR